MIKVPEFMKQVFPKFVNPTNPLIFEGGIIGEDCSI